MLTTFAACNVAWRISHENGELEFVVLDYSSIDPETGKRTKPEVRFPAGMWASGESTEETSVRKFEEETGLKAIDTELIAKKGSEEHEKGVFLISLRECLGELRKGPLKTPDGDELSEPRLVLARELKKVIAPVHYWAYRAAVETLRKRRIVP